MQGKSRLQLYKTLPGVDMKIIIILISMLLFSLNTFAIVGQETEQTGLPKQEQQTVKKSVIIVHDDKPGQQPNSSSDKENTGSSQFDENVKPEDNN